MRFCIALLLSALQLPGADIYISQTGAGGQTGVDCSTAHTISWANSTYVWTAGDTLHLCGNFTNMLTVGGSGTAISPLKILFESGASYSADTFRDAITIDGTVGVGCINVGSHSFITIDGGANGSIYCTNNGYQKPFSNVVFAIVCKNGSGVEVRNLYMTNLYTRTASTDFGNGATAVVFEGTMTNYSVHNCTITYCSDAIEVNHSGFTSNVMIYSNSIAYCNWGVFCNDFAAGTTGSNFKIYSNQFDHWDVWDETSAGLYHHDGILLNLSSASSLNTNMQIYGNWFGPFCGANMSGHIFNRPDFSGTYRDIKVHDNLFTVGIPSQMPANASIYLEGTNALVFNNTLINTNATPSTTAISYGDRHSILNNLCMGYSVETYPTSDYTRLITNCNYNVWYQGNSWDDSNPAVGYNFSQWQARGWDAQGTTSKPTVDAHYVPTTGDTVARAKGTNLTQFASVDFYGNTRPASAAWTIGAFENTNQVVTATGSSLSTTGSINTSGGISF